jgi:glycosyltransferase involved in cell wall biosynthesis
MPTDQPSRPTVGVLITYYGERELLRECLDSLAGQRVAPDEVLIYDDASDTPASEYVPVGFPVRIIRSDVNHGPSYGRNALLRASKSAFVHFHDADDLFHPDWCARVRGVLDRQKTDAVFTEIRSFGPDGLVSERVLGLEQLAPGDDLVRFCIRGVLITQAGTYRRQSVLSIGGYRTDLWQSEDYDYHIRLAASGIRWEVIPDALVIQRLRPGARHYKWLEVWTSYLQAVERLSAELHHRYWPDLADAAVRAGSALFQLGDRDQAHHAFELATRIGPPNLSTHRRAYKVLTRTIGFESTERLAHSYRNLFPVGFRAYFASRGW